MLVFSPLDSEEGLFFLFRVTILNKEQVYKYNIPVLPAKENSSYCCLICKAQP